MSKYHPSKRHGCNCPECRALCEREPGWFMPDEIGAAAEWCGLSEEAFREQYLKANEMEGITMWSPRRAIGIGGHCIFLMNVKNNQAHRAVEGEVIRRAHGIWGTRGADPAPHGFAGRRGRREPHNKDGKCRIHSVKPFECRKVFGCEADRRHRRVREQMVKMVKTFA